MVKSRNQIGILGLRRGDVGGQGPPLQEKVKMEVERWVEIVP